MRLGIDFGTTSSRASLQMGNTLAAVKDPMKQGDTFPSSVFLTEKGEVLIGHAAERQRMKALDRYQREFKRDLGTKVPYRLGDRAMLPEHLIAEILRKLKSEADQMVGDRAPLASVVLTVPATYQELKRELMREAARSVGFQKVHLLEEPVAAAVYYAQKGSAGRGLKEGETLLVYDLGGGTFDVALIQKKGEGYRFLAQPAGDERCGGVDFDREIFQDFKSRCSPELRQKLEGQQRDIEALRLRAMLEEEINEIKHTLSETSEAEMYVPEDYHLSRETFYGLIAPFIERTLEPCRQVVREAGTDWKKIDSILMVGGSCRIPCIRERLEREFGRPVFRADNPEMAVCQGAALYDPTPVSSAATSAKATSAPAVPAKAAEKPKEQKPAQKIASPAEKPHTKRIGELNLQEQAVLFNINDADGRSMDINVRITLQAAAVAELFLHKRLALNADNKVIVKSTESVGDPLINSVLDEISAGAGRLTIAQWVGKNRHQVDEAILKRLMQRGIVTARKRKVLFVMETTDYPIVNRTPKEALKQAIRQAVTGQGQVDPALAMLISILARGGTVFTLSYVLTQEEGMRCSERIRQICNTDPIVKQVGEAILVAWQAEQSDKEDWTYPS